MAKRPFISGLFNSARRLRRNRRGAAMVEFALIGPLFIVVLCGILENGLILFTQTVLDNATRDASRLIMLGTPTSLQQFKDALCVTACTLIPESSLVVNVTSGNTFASLSSTLQTDASGNPINTKFLPGTSAQAVLIQVSYNRPFLIPIFGTFSGVNSELLMSTVALKAEPY
jgi:Flp pilus assembly protein TadG